MQIRQPVMLICGHLAVNLQRVGRASAANFAQPSAAVLQELTAAAAILQDMHR